MNNPAAQKITDKNTANNTGNTTEKKTAHGAPSRDSYGRIVHEAIESLRYGFVQTPYADENVIEAAAADEFFGETAAAETSGEHLAAAQKHPSEKNPDNHHQPNKSTATPQHAQPASHDSLERIRDEVHVCCACALSEKRTHAVAGEGASNPRVLVVGEAPGFNEDAQGRPFVGNAGQYLDKWLAAIGLSRAQNVYITNTVKCRPPGNRDPREEEYGACSAYLIRQIALLRPACIFAVGRIAARLLLGRDENSPLSAMRGRAHSYANIPVFVTYHPSAVLRNPSLRALVWSDLQVLKKHLDASAA